MEIYGTLGPACLDETILERMFQEGMTGIRLNLSHTTLKEAGHMINLYHRAAEAAGIQRPGLLIDMQGPEIRVGTMKAMNLSVGDQVILGENGIPVPELIYPYLLEGQEILLDDGKILLKVINKESLPGGEFSETDFSKEACLCEVLRGGCLKGRKSIALVGCDLPIPTLTQQDLENLKDAEDYGVTGIMQPFVRNKEDLMAVKKAMEEAGCGSLRLFAKIENCKGVEHLPEFLSVADEIVIARGDLGNAMPLWQLPGVQNRIATCCREAGVPFMVVTQMLASMEHRQVPTRAEVSDIYHAVMQGASSVMVTGETAVGEYPVEVITYLARTAGEALKDMKK